MMQFHTIRKNSETCVYVEGEIADINATQDDFEIYVCFNVHEKRADMLPFMLDIMASRIPEKSKITARYRNYKKTAKNIKILKRCTRCVMSYCTSNDTDNCIYMYDPNLGKPRKKENTQDQ